MIPTGSQDPFALRRQTIGAIHILTDGEIHWDIRKGVKLALALLPGTQEEKEAAANKVEDFFRQRIKAILLDEGVDYDIVDAVLTGAVDDVYAIFLKAHSMMDSHVKGVPNCLRKRRKRICMLLLKKQEKKLPTLIMRMIMAAPFLP